VTITLPDWLLTSLGALAVLVVVLLAVVGAWFMWAFRNGIGFAVVLGFLWTQAASAAPCRDVVSGAFIKCPETFVLEAGVGVVASLSSQASAGEPTAELALGFDVADANKSPRLDLVAAFRALPGATVDLADPTTFRSMGLEGYLSQPLSSVLRLKPAVLIGLEFRFDGDSAPLHRAARFGYLGVRFDSKAGFLFLGGGGDERLSTAPRDAPQYLPSATVAWRLRLANVTGKVDAYLTGRVILYLRTGYGIREAGSDVAQIGVLIGGGKR
jgi:hypothetical protein